MSASAVQRGHKNYLKLYLSCLRWSGEFQPYQGKVCNFVVEIKLSWNPGLAISCSCFTEFLCLYNVLKSSRMLLFSC